MKPLSELEEHRRELLARCDAQREDIVSRLGHLGPRRWAQALASGAATGAVGALRSQRRHPLRCCCCAGRATPCSCCRGRVAH